MDNSDQKRCDFCTAPLPLVMYGANDTQADIGDGQIVGLDGGWKACDECEAMIDKEDWDGLTRHHLRNYKEQAEMRAKKFQIPLVQVYAIIEKSVDRAYEIFRQTRTGEKTRLAHTIQ